MVFFFLFSLLFFGYCGAGSTSKTVTLSLSYSDFSAKYLVNTAIADNTATVSHSGLLDLSFALDPATPSLPSGLKLDSQTGKIYGTPSTVAAAASYKVIVTRSNSGITASTTLNIEITKFLDNGDGTVTDKINNNIWQKCSYPQNWNSTSGSCTGTPGKLSWQAATDHCKNLAFAGKTKGSWDLPNYEESNSLIDKSKGSPTIDTKYFPNTVSDWYWSSFVTSSTRASAINFLDGSVNVNSLQSSSYSVLCEIGKKL